MGQVSQDDRILQLTNLCAHSLAKAIELMDRAGLILSVDEAHATQMIYGFIVPSKYGDSTNEHQGKTKHMDFFNQNIRVSQTGKYSKRLISSPNLERLGKNGYIQASIRCKSTLVVQWWYNGSGNQLVNYVNIK